MAGRTENRAIAAEDHRQIRQLLLGGQQTGNGLTRAPDMAVVTSAAEGLQLLALLTGFTLSRLAVSPIDHPDPIETHGPCGWLPAEQIELFHVDGNPVAIKRQQDGQTQRPQQQPR